MKWELQLKQCNGYFVGLTSAILAIELRMKKRIDKRTALDTA